jgi:multiple sugar transport system substrate-binding protein
MRQVSRAPKVLIVLAASLVAAGCGSSEGGSGAKAINWYVFNEPGGAYEQAVKDCNAQAKGRYRINYVRLPTDANQQRELVVRRLAAKDSTVDLVGMDVIWTAEFAEAGWIKPWVGPRARQATQGKLEGPLKTVQYQGKIWALPFTSNTQLLWYRKDRVKKPPKDLTWDEMIDSAARQKKAIEVQSKQYEGLTVWINAMTLGAGGQIVDQQGNVKVSDNAKQAAEIERKLASTGTAPPNYGNTAEDDARLGFQTGRSDYEVNYTYIYPSAAEVPGFQKKIGWTRYPRTDRDRPSRPPLGGINLGVGAYTKKPELAFEAATCLANNDNQAIASEKGGLPPTTEAVYNDPRVKKAFPFAAELRESINDAGPRPVTPAYSDISLAIQKTFHQPNKVDPNTVVQKLKDRLDKAAEGKIF